MAGGGSVPAAQKIFSCRRGPKISPPALFARRGRPPAKQPDMYRPSDNPHSAPLARRLSMFGMSELPNRWIVEHHLMVHTSLGTLKEEIDR